MIRAHWFHCDWNVCGEIPQKKKKNKQISTMCPYVWLKIQQANWSYMIWRNKIAFVNNIYLLIIFESKVFRQQFPKHVRLHFLFNACDCRFDQMKEITLTHSILEMKMFRWIEKKKIGKYICCKFERVLRKDLRLIYKFIETKILQNIYLFFYKVFQWRVQRWFMVHATNP